jgi:cellulose biosynthesis protein BcsQ
VLDLDTQGSALAWSSMRREGSRLEGIAVSLAVKKSDTRIALPRLREPTAGFDVAILDGPAREPGITRSAAAFADVALIPIAPGPCDFWAVSDTLEQLDAADELRAESGRPPVARCFVVNAARIGTTLARDAQTEIEANLGAYVGTIHHRVSFPLAVNRGESVFTMPTSIEAAAEIERLWRALKGTHGSKLKESNQAPAGRARRGRVAVRR